MTEERRKEILNNLKQMEKCLTGIEDELNTNNIMGRKDSFSYLDVQINTLYEYIGEITETVNKESES